MVTLSTTHHFSFTVADMDRSLAFYRDLLGLSVAADWISEAQYLRDITGFPNARLRLALLRLPGTAGRLELIQYLEPAGAQRELPTNVPGAAHIGFAVPDLDTAYQELRGRGVQFKSEPVEITSAAHHGARGVYMVDPDGITIELFQPPAAS